LKEFYPEDDRIRLQPINNREYEPLIVPAEDVVIQGVYVETFRHLHRRKN
jgi:SOS-response transcriptional repressor LexA